MIYMDLEKIYKERNIPNKYVLTLVLAARARQLSDRKAVVEGMDEKYISMAVDDVVKGRISYKIVDSTEDTKKTEVKNEQLETI